MSLGNRSVLRRAACHPYWVDGRRAAVSPSGAAPTRRSAGRSGHDDRCEGRAETSAGVDFEAASGVVVDDWWVREWQ